MDWMDWVEFEPKTKADVISKIENDGYTYPHYDKKRNNVRYVICLEAIIKDCHRLGIVLSEVYPLQMTLFNRRNQWIK